MFNQAVFPGKYIQGAGALQELPALSRSLGGSGLLLASPTVRRKILPGSGLEARCADLHIEEFGGECCEEELSRVAELVSTRQARFLAGMGGGKTIDTAKIAADRANIPVLVIPSIASTDAPCSGCAVLYRRDGVFERVFYQKANPFAVLVDSAVIAAAPVRFLVAGMGDALATWFEARSCQQSQSVNECGGRCTLAGAALAKLCYDTLLEYGWVAKLAAEKHLVTPALEKIIEANILLSGIGFESAGLAAAHAVHNGLTALNQTHAFYHGEKVAFGVLTGLQLTGAGQPETAAVYDFCQQVGLPLTLADLGLAEVSRQQLLPAAELACAPEQPISHEGGEMTPARVLDAMLAADALGAAWKAAAKARP
ncbi:MAG: glycerol dehydrogenase [Oligosphaeraceae bacterium]|nr:glycerol dehydrogenase [Oligosphaeraceae bacterium]